jgi:hypothetical protein
MWVPNSLRGPSLEPSAVFGEPAAWERDNFVGASARIRSSRGGDRSTLSLGAEDEQRDGDKRVQERCLLHYAPQERSASSKTCRNGDTLDHDAAIELARAQRAPGGRTAAKRPSCLRVDPRLVGEVPG